MMGKRSLGTLIFIHNLLKRLTEPPKSCSERTEDFWFLLMEEQGKEKDDKDK
jgi:hypothetical protein